MARKKPTRKAKRKAPKRKVVARRKPPRKKPPKKKRRKLVPVSKAVLSGGIYAGDPTSGQISAPPRP